ncbi:MAG TPA: hypothetical protein VN256_17245 [Pyrinomonadaceae bacterium]|nr:hypothetical protein [Pyrinomonadaceae bacterium]
MRKTIVLTFTAAALLMAAAVALDTYGREDSEPRMPAWGGVQFVMAECSAGSLHPWENPSFLPGLLSLSVFIAGVMLWQSEANAQAQRLLGLGLEAWPPERIARAAAVNIRAGGAPPVTSR